jgi:hypothetical protein
MPAAGELGVHGGLLGRLVDAGVEDQGGLGDEDGAAGMAVAAGMTTGEVCLVGVFAVSPSTVSFVPECRVSQLQSIWDQVQHQESRAVRA